MNFLWETEHPEGLASKKTQESTRNATCTIIVSVMPRSTDKDCSKIGSNTEEVSPPGPDPNHLDGVASLVLLQSTLLKDCQIAWLTGESPLPSESLPDCINYPLYDSRRSLAVGEGMQTNHWRVCWAEAGAMEANNAWTNWFVLTFVLFVLSILGVDVGFGTVWSELVFPPTPTFGPGASNPNFRGTVRYGFFFSCRNWDFPICGCGATPEEQNFCELSPVIFFFSWGNKMPPQGSRSSVDDIPNEKHE